MNGKLFVVSLTIGNLKDITLRALEVLGEVGFVAAEDTRVVGSFFAKHSISKPNWISYRDQNHDKVVGRILDILYSGQDVALVSDRGTPAISDPGFKLVRDVIEAGIEVVTIPGPSAVIAALSISGLPTDRFTFLGFLPKAKNKQIELISSCIQLESTFVIYESPHRIRKLIKLIGENFPEIKLAAAKELTKMYEHVYRGTPSEIYDQLGDNVKGEWVLLGSSK